MICSIQSLAPHILKRAFWTIVILAVVTGAMQIVLILSWIASRPSWQISTRNTPAGAVIEVYKSDSEYPTYKTLLSGERIGVEVNRILRTELPPELGCTTFYDDTIRPGRWTFEMNKTRIDIMERAMILNGTTEIAPQEKHQ